MQKTSPVRSPNPCNTKNGAEDAGNSNCAVVVQIPSPQCQICLQPWGNGWRDTCRSDFAGLFDFFAEKAWKRASPWVWPDAMLMTILIKLCPLSQLSWIPETNLLRAFTPDRACLSTVYFWCVNPEGYQVPNQQSSIRPRVARHTCSRWLHHFVFSITSRTSTL